VTQDKYILLLPHFNYTKKRLSLQHLPIRKLL